MLVVPTAVADLVDAFGPAKGTSFLLTGTATPGSQRVAHREDVAWFERSADELDGDAEPTIDAAERALVSASVGGLVSIWRWPNGKDVALVVDGDVDHPTGVEPECARYVAPAIETARRADFGAYGIFAAAANVDAEPASFPPGAEYYNHSYTHPYSHWNDRPWEALDRDAMCAELTRSAETFRRHLRTDDRRLFRLPHFQLTASDLTYDVLEDLGYRAESSIGANRSITGGLPFHPARRAWSDREDEAAYSRSHPEAAGRRPFLQLPISTDPTDPSFPNGCCSYNTLGEGVRARTADPAAYEGVLQDVLDRATTRRGLAHLFIDPPDAGYGRLAGDEPDYASAVERWMRRAVERDDIAIMSASQLAEWWLARERALEQMTLAIDGDDLVVEIPEPPAGATLAVRPFGRTAAWSRVTVGTAS
jgi:hypothetical protein